MKNFDDRNELQIILRNEEVYECLTKDEKELKNILNEGVIAKYLLNPEYEILTQNGEKIKNINSRDSIVLTKDGDLSLLTYDSKKYDYEYIDIEDMIVKEKTFNNSFNLLNSKDKNEFVSIVKEFDVLDTVCNRLKSKLKNYFNPKMNSIPRYKTSNVDLLNERNKMISLIQNLEQQNKKNNKSVEKEGFFDVGYSNQSFR